MVVLASGLTLALPAAGEKKARKRETAGKRALSRQLGARVVGRLLLLGC